MIKVEFPIRFSGCSVSSLTQACISRILFIQPGNIPAHDIIGPEKVRRILPLDVGIPGVVALQPGEGQQRGVLFEDVIGLDPALLPLSWLQCNDAWYTYV